MPEFRKDPVVGRWVIVAEERGTKPYQFGEGWERESSFPCVFCPGRESCTPPEVFSIREKDTLPNERGWRVRVVPNRFPALLPCEPLHQYIDGFYERMSGFGVHEVIIETPDHYLDLVDLPLEQIEEVLRVYRERMRELGEDPRLRYCLIFKNQGEKAGASLPHAHSQLIATPVIPKKVQEELKRAREFYEEEGKCLFCSLLEEERKKERLVWEEEGFMAFVPYAARFPYETWILPQRHCAFFSEIEEEEIQSLARILKIALSAIKALLHDPAFNFILHVAPYPRSSENYADYYHWHLEILPSLCKMAGFEWGTGFYINPVVPEKAAKALRQFIKDKS
ncbi:MAG TPA: galactose-1-phosphate uridylyltransferase [Candidatus Atribacteria bacterium]|jgi:UDPglucose--hexose-1-phosphate uridylyltransferase|nr:galactose-1-phosphate uridylyltransferase [Candidatus Atribacteria bacterium]